MNLKNKPKPTSSERGYPDLHDHIQKLRDNDLLQIVNEPVNKDTEVMPLVRWQFRGGVPENQRKAFLFNKVTDSCGRKYDIPLVVGALAATPAIYSIGMGVTLSDIGKQWKKALDEPLSPVEIDSAPCHEIVSRGSDLEGENSGLNNLPTPISTPGFDVAPYLTATSCITRDPDTRVQNMGTYRGGIKSSNRIGLKMFVNMRQGGHTHWLNWKTKGKKMPMVIMVGGPPSLAYVSSQKIREGLDEISVAGALAGAPIRVTTAKPVDLLVPADAEIIIEGLLDTEMLEPEGPFGESHGHINLEEYNFIFEVTAITRRSDAIMPSIISQVTPSESSVIKRVGMEPKFLNHLQEALGIKGIKHVSLHEPLTNIRRLVFIQFEREVPTTEIWRALYGAAHFDSACGKYVVAVNEDIDPENGDAVFWALAYRANPSLDIEILKHRDRGHGPALERGSGEDATLLIDATLKTDMPPIALPKKVFMENAKVLWERLNLGPLKPEVPWHGYSLGDWSEEWANMADRAASGGYLENGRRSAQLRRNDVSPNTSIRDVDPVSEKG